MNEVAVQKGRICVTGGTGFLGSWLVKRLLQDGYSVNATIRTLHPACPIYQMAKGTPATTQIYPARRRGYGFSEQISTVPAASPQPRRVARCSGVFHVAHPIDFDDVETEEIKIRRVTNALHGILQACLDSKTVKRVVYTSSIAAVAFHEAAAHVVTDETHWTSVDVVRRWGVYGGSYMVAKTVTERAALDFAEKHGLDLVTVLPSWIHGPFITPACPLSVRLSMALIFGDERSYRQHVGMSLVHVDDVARAHIHLFEKPNAKGRYICSSVRTTIHELHQFISLKFPQYELPTADSLKDLMRSSSVVGFSSNRLLQTGFRFENGLEEMFGGAIQTCKEKGFL